MMPTRGGDVLKKLSQRETFWIDTLNTMTPNGFNDDFSLKCFLREIVSCLVSCFITRCGVLLIGPCVLIGSQVIRVQPPAVVSKSRTFFCVYTWLK